MATDERIKSDKDHYDLSREAARISALSSGKYREILVSYNFQSTNFLLP